MVVFRLPAPKPFGLLNAYSVADRESEAFVRYLFCLFQGVNAGGVNGGLNCVELGFLGFVCG